MGTSATPSAPPPSGAAPAPAAPAAPANGIIPAPNKPQVMSIQEAAEAGRELLRQRVESQTVAAPGAKPADAPAETAEQKAQREADEAIIAAETPEQREAREADEAAAAAAAGAAPDDQLETPPAELTVQLGPVRDGEEPLDIVMPDKEAADRVRALIRGAVRGDQARQIREQAQSIRDEAENINYEIELDPAGAVLQRIQDARDVDHLFKYLATRPGVLQRSVEWIADIIEHPETLAGQSSLMEAERVTRRDQVRPKIEAKRSEDQNARAVLRGITQAIDDLAPDSFNDEQRQRLYDYAKVEIRDFARARNLRVVDPKIAGEAVAYVLKSFGVAPRDKSKPASGIHGRGATPSAPPPKRQPTPEEIKAARARRFSAASAPPGAGSATPSIPKPPKGSSIKEAAAFARRFYGALRGKPQ